MNTPKATIDFETRSVCSLTTAGTWRYSLDPSTDILCLGFRLPTWNLGRTALWHPEFPGMGIMTERDHEDALELVEWIESDRLVEAHNAFFERAMWVNKLAPVYGFPTIQNDQWRCSAAKAASHALPRGLDAALEALRLTIRKDAEGEAVNKKMYKPRKPVKAERVAWAVKHAGCPACLGKGKIKVGRAKATKCEACAGLGWKGHVPDFPLVYHETDEMFANLFAYCRQDVLAEEALSDALPDLSPEETAIYLLDQTVNERGFRLDEQAVTSALTLIEGEQAKGLIELRELTNGEVQKASQRAQMIAWLASEGCYLPNTQKQTLDDQLLSPYISNRVRQAIGLIKTIGRSSTAKYKTMQAHMSPVDQRVRGGLKYHGATTGRWSGSGVQPHNFPKGKIEDIDTAWEVLKTEETDLIEDYGGDVMELLSFALRGAIIASEGNTLYVADYSSIEARVLLWMAEDHEGLDIFRRGEDIYCDMASTIYKRIVTKKDKDERALGKVAILGLGYQMGATKFVDTALLMGGVTIPEDVYCTDCGEPLKKHDHVKPRHAFEGDMTQMTAVKTVDAYRAKYWRVVNMWNDQNAAAIAAVEERGREVYEGKVMWQCRGKFLYCTLPSGRALAYPDPEVHYVDTPWGEPRATLTFMGVNTYNHQWERQNTYGGKIVENQVQAVSRDLLAAALLRCEMSDTYAPILSVHDEIICEAVIGGGTVEEYTLLMTTLPDWAYGCPVEADSWAGVRYRK